MTQTTDLFQPLKLLTFAFLLAIVGQSCVSHSDLLALNQTGASPDDSPIDTTVQQLSVYEYTPYRIRPFDQLMIRINAFEGSTEEFLNREFSGNSGTIQQYDPSSLYFNSYNVNDSGYIYLPIIDTLKAAGLTVNELKITLDEAYKPYLKFASTNIKLANIRVTVLGEVRNPGVNYLYKEPTTIYDAISMAGGISDFGNRERIKLIRQTSEGAKTVYLDLKSTDLLSTEYFYMQPNDLIYIEPLKAKATEVSSQAIGIVFSAISILALLANILIR